MHRIPGVAVLQRPSIWADDSDRDSPRYLRRYPGDRAGDSENDTRATLRMGLMAGNPEDITRFEVIDHAPGAVSYHPDAARSLVATNVKVELSVQDEGRTLKVFLTRLDADG